MAARKRNDDEEKFLESYEPKEFPRPSVTVDLAVFTVIDALLHVLLVKRGQHPFKEQLALPGGFVRVGRDRHEQGESLVEAARRELREETGLDADLLLEQFHTFGTPGRDPRMRVISVGYVALVRPDLAPLVRGGGDARHAEWHAVEPIVAKKGQLAFDHDEVLATALAYVRRSLDQEGPRLAFDLVPRTFTIPELRSVHEVVLGIEQDPGNFRRRFHRLLDDGVLEKAPGKRITASKPATVYRFTGR